MSSTNLLMTPSVASTPRAAQIARSEGKGKVEYVISRINGQADQPLWCIQPFRKAGGRRVNWSGFGPALLSTFLGAALAAVLAVPAGLFLDRAQRRRTARKDAQQAASILSKALGANAERPAALAGTLGRKADIIEELLALELDAETWETVRPLVGEHLPVDLAASLSRHFSGARWVERAVEVLIRLPQTRNSPASSSIHPFLRI
jgi:hypothetical protein